MKRYKHSMRFKVETESGTINKRVYGETLKECEQKKAELLQKIAAEKAEKLQPAFASVAKAWRAESESRLSPYTYSCYKKPCDDLVEQFGKKKLKDVKTSELQSLINKMHEQGFAHHTIAMRKIAASQIFIYAIQRDLVEYNPATAVRIPRGAPKKHFELPTPQEIEKVKTSLDAPLGLFHFFLLYTGMRREEALAIDWMDIDFNSKSIVINKALRFVNGKGVITNMTKTDDSTRVIPLLEPLENALTPHRQDSGLIFGADGEPFTMSRYNFLSRKYKEVTQSSVTPHMLRVAYATILYDANMSDKDAKELMGHSKIELTKNVYMRISQARQKQNFEQLNDFVKNNI